MADVSDKATLIRCSCLEINSFLFCYRKYVIAGLAGLGGNWLKRCIEKTQPINSNSKKFLSGSIYFS